MSFMANPIHAYHPLPPVRFISTLKAVGYNGHISIEHEDGLMSPKEGLEKAVSFLKEVLIYEDAGEMWWA